MAEHMERVKRARSPKSVMRSQIAKPVVGKKSVASNTTNYDCPSCEEKDRLIKNLLTDMRDNNGLREDYLVAIKYINSCHTFINNFVRAINNTRPESEQLNVNLPDIPNFLTLFNSLYKVNRPRENSTTEMPRLDLKRMQDIDEPNEIESPTTPKFNWKNHRNNQSRARSPQVKQSEIRQQENNRIGKVRANSSDAETDTSSISRKESKTTQETIVVKPPKKSAQASTNTIGNPVTNKNTVRNVSVSNVLENQKSNYEQKGKRVGSGGASVGTKKVDCSGSNRSIPRSKSFVCNTKMSGDYNNKTNAYSQLTLEDIDKYASELLESAVKNSMSTVESKNKIATKKVSFVDERKVSNKMSGTENLNLFLNNDGNKNNARDISQSHFPAQSNVTNNDPNTWMTYLLSTQMNQIMATCAKTIIDNCNKQSVPKMEVEENTPPFSSRVSSNNSVNFQNNFLNTKCFQQSPETYNRYPNPTFDYSVEEKMKKERNVPKNMFSNVYSRGLTNDSSILRETAEVKHSDSIILSDQEVQNDSVDTEFIPSDSDIEVTPNRVKIIRKKKTKVRDFSENTKFPKCFSDSGYLSFDEPKLSPKVPGNPFQLSKKSMEMLDPKMISTIGLFTHDGDVAQLIEQEKNQRANDKRNKVFRTTRNSDSNEYMQQRNKNKSCATVSHKSTGSGSDPFASTDSSDIRSDGEYGEAVKRKPNTKLPKPSSANSGRHCVRF